MTVKEISCILMSEESQAVGVLLTRYVYDMLACTYRCVYVESVKHQIFFLLLSAFLSETGSHRTLSSLISYIV